jgi:hypothetical protein
MIARGRRLPRTGPPGGAWLALLAVAMQALVPFFLMVEVARANEPGGAAIICSTLGDNTHQSSGNATDRGLAAHCCSICSAVAAAQGIAPPVAPPLPLPLSIGHITLVPVDVASSTLVLTSPYRSRGPPSIA